MNIKQKAEFDDLDLRMQNILWFAYNYPNYCRYLEGNCPHKQNCLFIENCPFSRAKVKYWLEHNDFSNKGVKSEVSEL